MSLDWIPTMVAESVTSNNPDNNALFAHTSNFYMKSRSTANISLILPKTHFHYGQTCLLSHILSSSVSIPRFYTIRNATFSHSGETLLRKTIPGVAEKNSHLPDPCTISTSTLSPSEKEWAIAGYAVCTGIY